VHIAVPLAARSEQIWWSSVPSIRVAIVLVCWVVRDSLFLRAWGRDERWRGLGGRASFAAAPRALNCSSTHGDKLLNCFSLAGKPTM